MNWAAISWLILVAVCLGVEAMCPIHLVSAWFAAGALAAMTASLLGGAFWLQMTLFLVISGALVIAFWPLAKKYMNPTVVPTNIDSVIGSVGLVTSPIDNVTAQGQVKLNGMEWTARSTSGDPIGLGQKVKVDRIEGVKVFVSPAEVAAPL